MKSLTMLQLAKAIRELRDDPRFNQSKSVARRMAATLFADLDDALGYMLGFIKTEPRDPRKILIELEYKLS